MHSKYSLPWSVLGDSLFWKVRLHLSKKLLTRHLFWEFRHFSMVEECEFFPDALAPTNRVSGCFVVWGVHLRNAFVYTASVTNTSITNGKWFCLLESTKARRRQSRNIGPRGRTRLCVSEWSSLISTTHPLNPHMVNGTPTPTSTLLLSDVRSALWPLKATYLSASQERSEESLCAKRSSLYLPSRHFLWEWEMYNWGWRSWGW